MTHAASEERRVRTFWRTGAVVALLVTLAACGDAEPEGPLVARAGDAELGVDRTVSLLVDQEGIPNEAQVVEALADLWIDYTLLATAVAEDSTFGFVDLEPLVRQQLDQEVILQYRDSVLEVDTLVTEEELRAAYDQDAPAATELRARHILLGYPQGATQEQRDSVRARAEELRARLVGGASFEELAREHSEDPGSARRGGDLGFFSRGEMVRPFEEAAFSLEPGELGPVVESPFGLHIIRVEERRSPAFEQVRDDLRTRILNRRLVTADSALVAGLEGDASPEVVEEGPQLARALAAEPARRLTGRAADRPLARYEGGAYTAGEFQRFIRTREPQFRQQLQAASDEQIGNFLRGMVQRELLLRQAEAAGMEPDPQRVDSLVAGARERLRGVAREIGVLRLERAPGEALEPAVQRAVEDALLDVLTGATDVIPLGQISFQLRQGVPTRVSEAGVGQVVLRVGQARAGRAPSPAEDVLPADSSLLPPADPGR